eukprot:6015286-Alexandrium_andersonii.AAC.1
MAAEHHWGLPHLGGLVAHTSAGWWLRLPRAPSPSGPGLPWELGGKGQCHRRRSGWLGRPGPLVTRDPREDLLPCCLGQLT